MLETMIEIAKVFGVPVAVLFIFIWRDYAREQYQNAERTKLAERLNKVEDYQRNRLETIVVETCAAITAHTNTQKMLIQALNLRPCIAKHIPNGG